MQSRKHARERVAPIATRWNRHRFSQNRELAQSVPDAAVNEPVKTSEIEWDNKTRDLVRVYYREHINLMSKIVLERTAGPRDLPRTAGRPPFRRLSFLSHLVVHTSPVFWKPHICQCRLWACVSGSRRSLKHWHSSWAVNHFPAPDKAQITDTCPCSCNLLQLYSHYIIWKWMDNNYTKFNSDNIVLEMNISNHWN